MRAAVGDDDGGPSPAGGDTWLLAAVVLGALGALLTGCCLLVLLVGVPAPGLAR